MHQVREKRFGAGRGVVCKTKHLDWKPYRKDRQTPGGLYSFMWD
jgi:hypothetical protein